MGAANRVIAGDYEGYVIMASGNRVCMGKGFRVTDIDKNTVESYELITDEHRKSAASGIGRGIVGGVLLGPVGMIGGALSAKNKGTYQMALMFKDGQRSLIEVDDKIYKALIKKLF